MKFIIANAQLGVDQVKIEDAVDLAKLPKHLRR